MPTRHCWSKCGSMDESLLNTSVCVDENLVPGLQIRYTSFDDARIRELNETGSTLADYPSCNSFGCPEKKAAAPRYDASRFTPSPPIVLLFRRVPSRMSDEEIDDALFHELKRRHVTGGCVALLERFTAPSGESMAFVATDNPLIGATLGHSTVKLDGEDVPVSIVPELSIAKNGEFILQPEDKARLATRLRDQWAAPEQWAPELYAGPPAVVPEETNQGMSPRQMVVAYIQGRLCLSCDSTKHPMPKCPNGAFVCPNCHGSCHRGTECRQACRFCGRVHMGIGIMQCIKAHCASAKLCPVRDVQIDGAEVYIPEDLVPQMPILEDTHDLCRPDDSFGRSVWLSRIPREAVNKDLANAVQAKCSSGRVVRVSRRVGCDWAYVEMDSLKAAYEIVSMPLSIDGVPLKVQFRKSQHPMYEQPGYVMNDADGLNMSWIPT